MELIVVSDTHGRSDRLAEVMRRTKCSILLFLVDGLRDLNVVRDDVTVRSVRGNCDFFGGDIPEERIENFGTCCIFMTHGHRYGVKGDLSLAMAAAARAGADILMYGHTHVPHNVYIPAGTQVGDTVLEKPLTVFCPGSLGQPCDGVATFGVLTLRDGAWLTSHGQL